MLYTKEQIRDGLIRWIDDDVIPRLPTSGKWIVGTAVGLAMNNAMAVLDNDYVKMLGIVTDDGMVDADKVVQELKHNADKYGKMTISIPMMGKMSFSSEDIDSIRRHIM